MAMKKVTRPAIRPHRKYLHLTSRKLLTETLSYLAAEWDDGSTYGEWVITIGARKMDVQERHGLRVHYGQHCLTDHNNELHFMGL